MRETSRITFEEIEAEGLLGELQKRAWHTLSIHGPLTGREAEKISSVPGLWKRMSELERMGAVEGVAVRLCLVTGRSSTVWQITNRRPVKCSVALPSSTPSLPRDHSSKDGGPLRPPRNLPMSNWWPDSDPQSANTAAQEPTVTSPPSAAKVDVLKAGDRKSKKAPTTLEEIRNAHTDTYRKAKLQRAKIEKKYLETPTPELRDEMNEWKGVMRGLASAIKHVEVLMADTDMFRVDK